MKNLNLFRKSARGSEGSTLASAVVRPSLDRRSTVVKHLAFMLLFLLGSLNVWGDEEVYKTALFGSSYNSKGVSAYTGVSFSSTNEDFTVNVTNANNNNSGWEYIKIGGKKGAYTGTITTSAAIDKAITKVALTIDAITASNVTSITLKTSTDGSSWVDAGTFDKSTGAKQVTITSPMENLYYQIEAVCTQGSSNGLLTISKVEFYAEKEETSDPTVSVTPASWDFGTVHASAEASKVFSVSGSNLTAGNLTLTVPDGFSVDPSSIAVDGTLAATNVTVSKNTSTEDDYAGNLSITGGGLANAKTVALTMTVDADPAPTGTFELFSGDIEEGDYVLVGYQTSSSKYYAMNSTVTSNQYLGITEVSIDANDQIVDPDASLVWTIEQSTNGYYIKQGSAYLDDNATSNKNYAQTVAEPTTTSEWTFAYDNTWTITNYGTETTKKTLSFNISASRVACYTAIQSGNTCFYLYKKVDGAVKPSAGLAFDAAQKLAKVAGTLTAPNLSTADGFDGTVTYASSDEAVVKVNASTGAITEIVAVGKAVITAHSDETENFREGSASYTIFVAEQAGTNEDPLTEASAKALIDNGCTLNVNVKGTVGVVGSLNTTYGSISLTLTDGFQFYGMLNTSGEQFTENPFVVGDVVTAVGNLKKHNTTYELDLNCQLVERIPFAGSKTSIANTKETAYTIAQALAYAADPTTYDLTDHVYIAGVVYQVNSFNSTNGTYNIYIKDAGTSEDDGKFEFYKCSGLYEVGGTPAQFAEGDVQIGDEVIGYGVMTYFSGGSIWEFGQPNQLVALNRPTVPVTSINLTESTATVEEGKTVTLHASVLPNNATDQDIVWTVVSGDTYASVDNGVVTGIAAGEAVIRAASHEDASIHEECTVTVTEPAPLSPWASVYTSNITLSTEGGTSASVAKVIFDETEGGYDAIKAGTGSAFGAIKVTVPAQATALHYHAYGWNGEAVTLSITAPDGVTVTPASQVIESNTGVKSSTPFTLAEGSDPKTEAYHAVSLSGNTEEIELTFTATGGKRFVLFGVNQEGGVVPELQSIEISGDLNKKSGYKAGDALDLDGLTVMATYTLGGTPQAPVDITDDAELAWSYDPLVENQTSVTITASYKGQTDDITINDLDPVASADPKIYVNNLNVNFGTVAPNASVEDKTITVTLTNVANATATLGGTNPEAFSITPASPAALTESGDITISVVSTANVGTYSATITISDDAEAATSKVVNLSLTVEDVETAVSTTSKWVAATEIADGVQVLIVGEDNGTFYAMSEDRGNNRGVVAGTIEEDVFTPGAQTMAFTLVAQDGGTYALRASNGKYLYAGGTGNSNWLNTKAYDGELDANAKWNIDLANSTIIATSSNRNEMRFNKTNNPKIISCYQSSSTSPTVALYVPKPAEYETVRSGLEVNRHYTVCLPKNITHIKGATFWNLQYKNAGNTEVYLVEETAPGAGKPYIIQATDTKLEVVYGEEIAANPVENGALRGTFADIDDEAFAALEGTVYLLINNAIRPRTTGNYLKANRAYVRYDLLTVPQTQNFAPGKRVRAMPMAPQVATGVDQVPSDQVPNTKVLIDGQLFILHGEKMYNVQGQLVK